MQKERLTTMLKQDRVRHPSGSCRGGASNCGNLDEHRSKEPRPRLQRNLVQVNSSANQIRRSVTEIRWGWGSEGGWDLLPKRSLAPVGRHSRPDPPLEGANKGYTWPTKHSGSTNPPAEMIPIVDQMAGSVTEAGGHASGDWRGASETTIMSPNKARKDDSGIGTTVGNKGKPPPTSFDFSTEARQPAGSIEQQKTEQASKSAMNFSGLIRVLVLVGAIAFVSAAPVCEDGCSGCENGSGCTEE
ncbi:hypothetical protein BDK51DRAFT_47870 [Blyttiomyces helicus]|uniref:Uncharacterized protein n=1 Tax=Blyttiomyces helicus TaxID=388810 RepID=A0A4P9W424_9FUNG|nr:hypothetical protein BDK51DRAFT_47870 [Blyttiomyces helicus]|eukprot:RKO85578.1 hypothetical protein BDK51DRAFT_47870 [Blyttiomyces helicus]